MSLENIQLPPSIIQDLFKKALIDTTLTQKSTHLSEEIAINFLGINKKHIIILINNKNAAFLDAISLKFLTDILSACKLTLEDVAIINLSHTPVDYQAINQQFRPTKVLALGISLEAIALPLQFPNYQLQEYDTITYLQAPDLLAIKNSKEEKAKLWGCLQKLLNI